MEELDALLDGVCARAAEIQHAQDPETELRLLLAPVRALFVQQRRRESAGSGSSSSTSTGGVSADSAASRPLNYLSGAAAKLHKMVARSPPSQRLSTLRNSAKGEKPAPTYLNGAANRLHALVTGSKTLSANTLRGRQQQSEAAVRIQALVRGKTQRQTLTRQRSVLVQGTKVLKKYVLKTDRFPNCHELQTPHGDIAPNFRRLEGTPLYGAAQPSLEGIQMILSRVAADGFTKVVWVNLREEAVVYVNGRPFTARRSAKLNENDLVPGITGHKIQVLESSLKSSLQEELKAADRRFEYWNEVALRENELVEDTAEPDHVLTLPEVYESAEVANYKDTIQSVVYHRIPIERENAPEHGDVEMLMNLMENTCADGATAFVFNCQMGKRRTTTAMVIGRLVYQRHTLDVKSLAPPADEVPENQVESGNFAVIREVQKRLKNGQEAKRWVDTAIDECATICNIRTVIHEYRDLSNAEAKPAKRSYYLHHAMSFLERYFYLIVFGAYMIETHEKYSGEEPAPDNDDEDEHPSFSKWLQQHPNLFRLLDDLGGVRYKSDKVLTSCVLKMDHFFGIARIPFELTTNVPNYRRISNEPIFGTAQCLEQGIIDVVEHLRGEFDRAIWINLREEAVIYATGRPFCVRHQDDLMVNVEYPGIEVDEITAIERQVKIELQAKVRKDNGLFMYWYEPREMVNDETMEHINPQADVKTLTEVYDDATQQSGFDLRYARIPVSDETAPEEKDLDDMVRLLLPAFMNELGLQLPSDESSSPAEKLKTAVICNCQMGRGRTTTALVCVYMLRVVLEDSASALASYDKPSLLKGVLGTRTAGHRRQSAAITAEFVVIRKLLKTLDNGSDCKLLVDYAIDQCEHMQNLRDCISQCRDLAVDRDLPSSKRDFFMLRAVNYLERYFYLMCFASYLLEERAHLFQRSLFVTWMNERYGSALYELLDNLCFEEEIGAEIHVSSMRWRWRRKRKLVSRLE
ncbi:Paladin [Phytophthora pseudosyringae]|uniref:Paladin n=1 Tax=Phytophthora pseudosyringae TaxID=221518 RepID=A0A8T1WD83_9STRA|nr:Paladin [Phytophthora pseudosyringae]